MDKVYAIVECLVTYENGTSEIRRPTYAEISVGLALVDYISVKKYLQETLPHIQKIEVIDNLYFKNQSDYESYLKSL